MEWQQLKMADTRTEGMPEFVFERRQRYMFTIWRLVDIVAGQPAIQGGTARYRSLACIEVGGGKKWQERHHPLGHRDIDHTRLATLHTSHSCRQYVDDGQEAA